MQAILLVTVFSCLLGAASAAGLGATCTPADGTQGDCADVNAICPTGTAVCQCKTGYTEYSGSCAANGGLGTACLATTPACTGDTLVCDSTVCKKKYGQACAATTECISRSTCSTTCTCNSGYTATATGFCNGVAPQSVSSWLLTGSIITLLVTLSLP